MAILDDDIARDIAEDNKAAEYIAAHLDDDLKERYDVDTLLTLIEAFTTCLAESDILDENPDSDGCVDLPLTALSEEIAAMLSREDVGTFPAEEIAVLFDLWLDFEEQQWDN